MYSAGSNKPVILKSLLLVVAALMICSSVAFAQAAESQSSSPIGNRDPGKTETALGSLVADAVRAKLNSNVAIITASELKPIIDPLPAGVVPSDSIAGLVSYPDDPLATLNLRGSVLKQALEKSVSMYPQQNLGFLQVSGLQFTFDPSKKVGERVTSVRVGNAQLNDESSYTVAVTNSLANGALGYWKVWSKDDIKQRFPDSTIKDAVEDYFRSHPKINYSTLSRIAVQ